jgi:hypothetical protein
LPEDCPVATETIRLFYCFITQLYVLPDGVNTSLKTTFVDILGYRLLSYVAVYLKETNIRQDKVQAGRLSH